MLPTVADRGDVRERRLADDREALWQTARQLLTSRQQRILHLCVEGWSAHDIADQLGLSAARVSDEKYKAICKLRKQLGAQQGASAL
jgi:RNA polymerase sigma factor (sigma-70 family)